MKRLVSRQLSRLSMIAAILSTIGGAMGLPRHVEAAPPVSNVGSCPNINQLGTFKIASNVAVSFSSSGDTITYSFSSTNENPAGGVPGLIKYCVYPSPMAQPTAHTLAAEGADGKPWIFGADSKDFMFARPSGNKSNIPLDGQTVTMGTATWATLPTTQTILHIADPAVCSSLYGAGTSTTCFVQPSNAGCLSGDTTVAYNAMPFGAVNCPKPSVGVEGYNFNEFGDAVTLKSGTGNQLASLNVLFTSYGCGVSGKWYDGTCVTSPNTTFDVPITATIYDEFLNLITSVTQTFTIPYRPTADPTCPELGQWFNPLANGGAGGCQYSISKVLTFTFPSGALVPVDRKVIWTVAYNSTNSGYAPKGDLACRTDNGGDPGCGYDSLNVGTTNFTNAPYAGTDDDNSLVVLSWNTGGYPTSGGTATPVQSTNGGISGLPATGWVGLRPLGEIITTP